MNPLYITAGIAALERSLQDTANADECYRCPSDPAGRIDALEPEPGLCRPCLDEVSHANENRRIQAAWDALGDDTYGGAA